MFKKFISLLTLLCLLPSCAAQRTVFFSDPPGAQVTVNGEVVGKTPCEYHYRAGTGKRYEVEVHKGDYQPVSEQIETDTVDKKSRARWLLAGLIWSPLWLGTFFTKKLQDSYHFVLTKVKQVVEPSAAEDEDQSLQNISRNNGTGIGCPTPTKPRKSS